MRTLVWVDEWQQQCCGATFTVGTQVRWTLTSPDPRRLSPLLGEDLAAAVEYAEERHGGLPEDAPATTATVRSIRAVLCRLAPAPGGDPCARHPVKGAAVLRWTHTSDAWPPRSENLRLEGYLVEVESDPAGSGPVPTGQIA
jgi:hypothetical protein